MQLYKGDCLEVIERAGIRGVDMVLCDPPYSSGGLFSGSRKASTRSKYTSEDYNGAARFQSFSGDNMDQRSFTEFMRMCLSRFRSVCRNGAICAVFIDWRNLPAMTDAFQMAGWVWRGIVVWDKGISRPNPDRFRNDCEYIVWGSNGESGGKPYPGCKNLPGCYHVKSVSTGQKHHQTEKPVPLLRKILAICKEGGTVFDPFMGSGSTGVAAIETGRDFIGIELDSGYYDSAALRISNAIRRRVNGPGKAQQGKAKR